MRIAGFWFAIYTLFCVVGSWMGLPPMHPYGRMDWTLPDPMIVWIILSIPPTVVFAIYDNKKPEDPQ